MKTQLLCSFYVARLFRQQPIAVAALLSTAIAAVISLALMLYWSARHTEADAALRTAQQHQPQHLVSAPLPSTNESISLPEFSSADFTAQFQSLAKDIGLPAEEVIYALESSPAEPYWRYRVSFEVKSGYPKIRKFIAALSSELPNVLLDAIRCRREGTTIPALTCELQMSAFFHKADRG